MHRLPKLYDTLRAFWLRDYLDDVRQLDHAIRKRAALPTGLQAVPPSVLTGDPFALTPGHCVLVLGKNPSFPGRPGDVEASCDDHRRKDFAGYYERRKLFFSDHDPLDQYNWRHFSRLGNLLRSHVPGLRGASAKEAFRDSVGVFDLLPWWSRDTSGINAQKLSSELEPLCCWRGVLRLTIETLQPTLVVVHGSGFLDAARAILETELRRFDFQSPNGYSGVAYSGRAAFGVPVLAHAQVTALGGPGTDEAYGALIQAWREGRGH